MNIHTIYGFFQRRFRPKRIRNLKAQLPVLGNAQATILDLGGVAAWWAEVKPAAREITIVNLDATHQKTCEAAGYHFLAADGRSLPFPDHEFDLVHSNSVIEHVGNLSDQHRFAVEMLRCGNAVYMQTPNRWFFVEPHLITVFIHWLPFRMQRHLIRWFSVWGLVNRPTQAQVDSFLSEIRLMSRSEVINCFPGCQLEEEKFMGMTKSFIMIRHASAARATPADKPADRLVA
jgi:hypothetical protein